MARKIIFCTGQTRAVKEKQKSLVSARQAQRTGQEKAPFICTRWVPIHLVSTISRGHPSLVSLMGTKELKYCSVRKNIFCTGPTRAAKAEQKSLNLSFNSQHGPPLYSLLLVGTSQRNFFSFFLKLWSAFHELGLFTKRYGFITAARWKLNRISSLIGTLLNT